MFLEIPGFFKWLLLLLLLLLSHFSCVRLSATPQKAAHQAPLSLGFPRQEYWSELPFLSPMHAGMLNCFSPIRLCETPWTAAQQAPLSTGFSRQEYWSGLPFPSPFNVLEMCKASHPQLTQSECPCGQESSCVDPAFHKGKAVRTQQMGHHPFLNC